MHSPANAAAAAAGDDDDECRQLEATVAAAKAASAAATARQDGDETESGWRTNAGHASRLSSRKVTKRGAARRCAEQTERIRGSMSGRNWRAQSGAGQREGGRASAAVSSAVAKICRLVHTQNA